MHGLRIRIRTPDVIGAVVVAAAVIALIVAAHGRSPAPTPAIQPHPGATTTTVRKAATTTRKTTLDGPCACAGYVWVGDVTSVAATWTVPRLKQSSVGFAGTWIGAESGRAGGPFIQVGINEVREAPRWALKAGLNASEFPASYLAFWSDTVHHYHPVLLGAVHPGEVVHASLQLRHGRWRVRITDPHAKLDAGFSTRQEAARPLLQADWLQEDVMDSKRERLYPYPRLSSFAFGNLRVSGRTPRRLAMYRQSMPARAGVDLTPGHLTVDQFTIAQQIEDRATS